MIFCFYLPLLILCHTQRFLKYEKYVHACTQCSAVERGRTQRLARAHAHSISFLILFHYCLFSNCYDYYIGIKCWVQLWLLVLLQLQWIHSNRNKIDVSYDIKLFFHVVFFSLNVRPHTFLRHLIFPLSLFLLNYN